MCCAKVLKCGTKPNLADVLCYSTEAWYITPTLVMCFVTVLKSGIKLNLGDVLCHSTAV